MQHNTCAVAYEHHATFCCSSPSFWMVFPPPSCLDNLVPKAIHRVGVSKAWEEEGCLQTLPSLFTLRDGPSWVKSRHVMRLLGPFPYTAQLHLIPADDSTMQTLPQRHCPCGTPGPSTEHLSSGLHPVQEAFTEANTQSAPCNMETPAGSPQRTVLVCFHCTGSYI